MQFIHNNIDTSIEKLVKTPSHLDHVLKYGSKSDVLYIWSRIYTLKEWNQQRSAFSNLRKYILLKFGTPKLPRPYTLYQHNINTDKHFLKNTCKIITTKCLRRDIAREINNSFKIIPMKSKSIANILVNVKKVTRQTVFKCAGPPWCNKDTHFTSDLADMKGSFGKIGRENSKLVPLDNSDSHIKAINIWLRKILTYKLGYSLLDSCHKNGDKDSFVSLIYNSSINRNILPISFIGYIAILLYITKTPHFLNFSSR